MTVLHEPQLASLAGMEITVEAAAGISLSDGDQWWGTRVKFREPPARRWDSRLLLDVHPFDSATIERALALSIGRPAE